MGKFIWCARAGTDQAHLTTKDVEDLRQFIQTARTQKSPEGSQARITISIQFGHRTIAPHQFLEVVLVSAGFSAHLHCPELPDGKMSPPETDPFLSVENRSW